MAIHAIHLLGDRHRGNSGTKLDAVRTGALSPLAASPSGVPTGVVPRQTGPGSEGSFAKRPRLDNREP
jgi:hypothetical protein